VRAPFGLGGELSCEVLTDFPERFAAGAEVWAEGRAYRVRQARPHKDVMLVTLDGVASRTRADAFRGVLLEVPESELASLGEGQYFRFQIVGIEVVDIAGKQLGRVAEVLETGANDVYIVRNDEGDLLVPATDEAIKQVNVAAGRMVVEVLVGLERRPHPKPRKRLRRI
jgi:16S rRNA processing protein RimM